VISPITPIIFDEVHKEAVKGAARAKRAVIKMTLKGASRRIAYAAVQSELRQGIRAVIARIREERRVLSSDTRRLSWVDWLQQLPVPEVQIL
jgi:hypothetical protein